MKIYFFLILLVSTSMVSAQGNSNHKTRKVVTTYGYTTTQLNHVKAPASEAIQTDKFYLNSTSNAMVKGGKNRVIFPIHLPESTKEWYYRFTASRNEEDINTTLTTFSLAGELTQYIDSKNPLKNAVNNLTTPPGANICDIYILNEEQAKLFKDKEDFDYDLSASRENYKSGIVAVKNTTNAPVFIGINNPDHLHGIHVAIEIVAIVENETTIEETIKIPIHTSYLE